VAVLGFATVQLIPFPTRIQRRTLEPDGIAVFQTQDTGDGSGGNLLVTVRADTNAFFYVLKAFTARVNAVSTPGELVVNYNPEWLNDVTASSVFFNVEVALAFIAHGSTFRPDAIGVAAALRAGETLPLGKISALTSATQNLLLFNYETNVNAGVYSTVGMLYAYRKEALTVPGFLETLIQPGLLR